MFCLAQPHFDPADAQCRHNYRPDFRLWFPEAYVRVGQHQRISFVDIRTVLLYISTLWAEIPLGRGDVGHPPCRASEVRPYHLVKPLSKGK